MLAIGLHSLGTEAFDRSDYAEAGPALEEVERLTSELSEADPENFERRLRLYVSRWSLAHLSKARGRFAEASERFRRLGQDLGAQKAAGRLEGSAAALNLFEQADAEALDCAEKARAVRDLDYVRSQPAPRQFALRAARTVAFAAEPGGGPAAAAEAVGLAEVDPAAAGPEGALALAIALARSAAALASAADFPGRADARNRANDRAIQALRAAIDGGFSDIGGLGHNDDAAPLRQIEGYRALIDRAKTHR